MLLQYQVLSYSVCNDISQELVEFSTEKNTWEEARSKAIALAIKWKETNESSTPYKGIKLDMQYGIRENGTKQFVIHLLNGKRMHTDDICKVLWDEASALEEMGLQFDYTLLDDGTTQQKVVTDSYIKLYYFTAD